MYLRVFGFIWGAILLTSALLATLLTLLDWAPPREAEVGFESAALRRLLTLEVTDGGQAQAMTSWQRIAPAFPDIIVTPSATCDARHVVPLPEDGCLVISSPLERGFGLHRIEPFLPPLTLGAVISALMAAALSRRIVRPLRTLGRAMGALSRGALQTRVSPELAGSGPELTRLGTAFDRAASQLQEFAESRRQLLHDLSHELRSPLARLGAAIAVLGKHPERHPAIMAQMSTDISRMDHMLGELLTLSLLSTSEVQISRQPLDLMDIVEPILSDANFEGEARQINVRYVGQDRLPVAGDAELLHRAVENTVRNAIAYSPPGTEVTVTGVLTDDAITLSIQDRGPGVAPSDLPEMFKPFRRFASSEGTKGAGLGMAIAARALTAHGGEITVAPRPGGGLSVTLHLPRDLEPAVLRP